MNPTPVLTPQAIAARWPSLTPQGARILRAIHAHGAPMSRTAIAKASGLPKANITRLLERTIAHGFTIEVARAEARATYAPLVALTDRGRSAATALAPDLLPTTVAADGLPTSLGLPSRAALALRAIHAAAIGGHVPTHRELGQAIGVLRANVGRALAQLVAAACVDPTDRMRLTPLGVAAAEGRVAVREDDVFRRAVSVTRSVSVAPRTPRPKKLAVAAPALPPPKPVPHDERAVPVASIVAIPPMLTTFRGIRHPPLPVAYARPKGVGAERWDWLTTYKASLRSDAA